MAAVVAVQPGEAGLGIGAGDERAKLALDERGEMGVGLEEAAEAFADDAVKGRLRGLAGHVARAGARDAHIE